MLRQALDRERIVVYDGWTRSFCFAGDAARAVVLLLEETGTWDVGRDDDPRPLLEVARLACRVAGAPEDLIDLVPPPAGPVNVERLDLDRLSALGWRPEVELEDGMRRTLDWLLSPRT